MQQDLHPSSRRFSRRSVRCSEKVHTVTIADSESRPQKKLQHRPKQGLGRRVVARTLIADVSPASSFCLPSFNTKRSSSVGIPASSEPKERELTEIHGQRSTTCEDDDESMASDGAKKRSRMSLSRPMLTRCLRAPSRRAILHCQRALRCDIAGLGASCQIRKIHRKKSSPACGQQRTTRRHP